MKKTLNLIVLVAILIFLNFSIYKKEQILTNGKVIYLELAPIDPRSLMQGDYMALRFKIEDKIKKALKKFNLSKNSKGKAIVTFNKQKLAKFKSLFKGEKLKPNEILLKYNIRDKRVHIGTNAFFFQEGKEKKYQNAKYGEFKIAPNGEMILIDLKKSLF